MKLKTKLALIVALTLPLLNACGGGSDLKGHVRLVNATSEYAGLDLYSGSDLISSNVASYAVGGYAELVPDTYTFNIKATGAAATAATTSQDANREDYNTLVAYTTGGTLTTTYLSDNEDAPSTGNAKLRIFNTASTDAGSVDVYLIDSDCSGIANSAAAATATAVTGLQTAYTEVSAAASGTAYHVCVTATGDKTDLRLDIPVLTLTNQQIATLILTRGAGGVLLNGLVLTEQGALVVDKNASARMRVAASATSGGSVTVTANGVSLGTGFVSPSVGGYVLVPAGDLTLSVLVNNTAVAATGLSAAPGADLTLLVAGSVATPTVALLNDDNTVSTSTTKPVKLRIVNGLNGVAGPVTLTVDNSNVGNAAAFGTASTPGIVAASAALAEVDAVYGGTNLVDMTDVTLTAGNVYTFFLLGDVSLPKGILRVDR